MARTRLSLIQRRNQTSAVEVWEEEDGRIVTYQDGKPLVAAEVNSLTGEITQQAAGISLPTSKLAKLPKIGNVGTYKFFGGTLTGDTAGAAGAGSSSVITTSLKFEAEGPFDAVRLIFVNHVTSGGLPLVKAVVSSTETAAVDTQANQFHPVSAAAANNALRSGTDTHGWNPVTFAGAATGTIPAGAAGLIPGFLSSDWIPCPSLARADGGTRPLVLVRTYVPVSTSNWSFVANAGLVGMASATAANRGRIVQIGNFYGDGVGTLGGSFSAATTSHAVFVQVRHRGRVVNVGFVGDSITQNDGLSADALSSWGRRAAYDASTPALPVIPANWGYSSQSSVTYQRNVATTSPPAGYTPAFSFARPDIAFYAPFSPNDLSTPTLRTVQDQLARLEDFFDYCAQNQILPVVWAPVPNDNYAAGPDAVRKAFMVQIRAMSASRGIYVCEFASSLGDGATPERYVAGYKFDAVHPNETAIETVMAPAAKGIIQALIV